MIEFEVINIKKENHRFTIEVEINETRERKFFGYPLGEGWENLNNNGEHKFMVDIQRKLEDLEEASKVDVDFDEIKKMYKGQKIKSKSKEIKKIEQNPKILKKG
jgi:hypothetical protein